MPPTLNPDSFLVVAAATALGGALAAGIARLDTLAHALGVIGAALLGVAGAARLVAGTDLAVDLGDFQGIIPRFRLDLLAAILWLVIAAVAVPAIAHAARDRRRRSPTTLALLVLGVAATAVAGDAHSLAVAWAVTIVAMAFAPRDGSEPEAPAPGILTEGLVAVFTLTTAIALLGAERGSVALDLPTRARSAGSLGALLLGAAAIALAGIAPFQRRRLDAATRATGPALALMTGAVPASAAALLLRGAIHWLPASSPWIAWALVAWLTIASLHALATGMSESRLPRAVSALLSACFGATLLTLALAIALGQAHARAAAADAAATALVQMVVFALLASAAQLAVASIVAQSGDEMHLHGGMLRRMPVAGATLLGALLGVAALPPFAGFAPMSFALRTATARMASTGAPLPLGAVIAVALTLLWAGAIAVALRIAVATLLGATRAELSERARDTARGQRTAVALAGALSLAPVLGAVSLAHLTAAVVNNLTGYTPTAMVAAAEAGNRQLLLFLLLVTGGAIVSVRRSREVADTWSNTLQPAPAAGGSPTALAQPFTATFPELLEARYESEVTPGPSDYAPAEIRTTARFTSAIGARGAALSHAGRDLLGRLRETRLAPEPGLAFWVAAAIALTLVS